MPRILHHSAQDFQPRFEEFLALKREASHDVEDAVRAILAAVKAKGDAALIEYTREFDQLNLEKTGIAFREEEIDDAIKSIPSKEVEALEFAAKRIEAYHRKQIPEDAFWEDEAGAMLGWRWRAVESAGLYVPGGLASYPSSVLMNAIPARVAGTKHLFMCSPTPNGKVNPLVLLAARLAGVETVYRIGGAQAIAALAFGTKTIPKVDVITGPGNAFVAAAKAKVYGHTGIDMIAGPSEILIIADRHNNPDWIALDLLSQAEHDQTAQSILITNDAAFAKHVENAVDRYLKTLKRREIAAASWEKNGAIILVDDFDQAAALSDRIAPEHLELCLEEAFIFSEKINHAGAVFIGSWTPEAIGDYVGGPNHVLPTAQSARFASGLSVLTFMKRTTVSQLSPKALGAIGHAAACLAESESLEAHALSIHARLNQLNDMNNGE